MYVSLQQNFKAVRETATRKKLTAEHTALVSKAQNSIHRTQLRPYKSPPSGKMFTCKKTNCSCTISRSTKAFPHFLENTNQGSSHFISSNNSFAHNTKTEKKTRNVNVSLMQNNFVYMVVLEMVTKEAMFMF